MRLGYARPSHQGPDLTAQLQALHGAGAERIWEERELGTQSRQPLLDDLLLQLRHGDALIVLRLDRLARSLHHLALIATTIRERGADLISLTDAIDTTTPDGRIFFHAVGIADDLERTLLAEDTISGLNDARARGVQLGRPRVLTPEQIEQARRLLTEPGATTTSVAEHMGVSRSTINRHALPVVEDTGTVLPAVAPPPEAPRGGRHAT
ncbi:recombinase family protein [Isoptericola jiangsuensis]|uniref:DNA invertase Pin-like site-specific DNA recombinase n=1 Tax=Isoptericola jiangsuensis TaxID=548579 RepID=A0A2A9EUX1_9MICO|nr:recombinase family protein [Isoptericola jiangsuensis]PFG42035.1 DNA invertase Pin-like site-specific DNA recombinase [Isoptericola jiangsuensis]